MKRSELLRKLQSEIRRHSFDTFVDSPPSVAQGCNDVVVPGCPACRKRLFTVQQFMDHLADDVLPAALDKLGTSRDNEGNAAPDPADQSAADRGAV